MNVVGAGADTTAISFRAIVRYICSNPRVYAKFQKEVDDAYVSGILSEIPQYSESQNLPYLQAVIKESLRMFPAVGYQLPRIVPKGGAQIGGYFIPATTVVGVNGWSLHRHHAIYGEDADCFRPERWLTGDIKAMENCYASFGFGTRTCIGKNMALMEISKIIPALCRNFDIEIVNPDQPWKVITAWFAYQTDFKVRLTRRVHKVSQDQGVIPIVSSRR
ncbi:hypothetical protein LTS15_002430 [Exophiala xenobiotica]|nr:hypothetical protein LTS15_002430 [Exophiala xenobiotica]